MRKYLFIIALLFPILLSAQTAQELVIEANEAYSRSEHRHAVELYEEAISMGWESPSLFYNLGNAYFKENQLGFAILNFERALRLDPTNEDILHNLEFARTRLTDRVDSRPLLFYERWWKSAWQFLSPDAWGTISIVLLTIFFTLLALYLFAKTIGMKKMAFYSGMIVLAFGMLSLIFAQKHYQFRNAENQAIVMQARLTAKSSPSVQSSDLFLIHEGTKVQIRNSLGEWFEIQLPNGNVGWVKKETIAII